MVLYVQMLTDTVVSDTPPASFAHPAPASIHRDLYGELLLLDLDIDDHASKCVDAAGKGFGAPVGSSKSVGAVKTLEAEYEWFTQTQLTVRNIADLGSDMKTQLLHQAMCERLEGQVSTIIAFMRELSVSTIPTSPHGPVPVVDTSKPPCMTGRNPHLPLRQHYSMIIH